MSKVKYAKAPQELIDRFRPARAAVRPLKCLAAKSADYAGPCWVSDGEQSMRNATCNACHQTSCFIGNSAVHARVLAEIIAS